MLPRRSRPEWDKVASSRIKEERARLGVSQEVLADELGVDRKTVGRWERGEAAPSAAQLAGMTVMGVDIRYVLTGQREGAASVNEVAHHRYLDDDPLCGQIRRLSERQRKAIADLLDVFAVKPGDD